MGMHVPLFLLSAMSAAVRNEIRSRAPDRIIGTEDDPYMLRWYLMPRGDEGNAYAHVFRRSDDDRALHDHPWDSLSVILSGRYIEHSIDAGGINRRVLRSTGDIVPRKATDAHRIELFDSDRAAGQFPETLFLTGDSVREWGFHCPDRGWVHWRDFAADESGNTIGKGCG